MQKFQDALLSVSGQPVVGASVEVRTLAGTLATLYSDNGATVASNPLITDASGEYSFYAANGRYTLSFSGAGVAPESRTDVLLFDPADASFGLQQITPGLAEEAAGGATDAGTFHFRRRATYSGGTPGFVNAALFVDTFVEATPGNPSTAAAFEWAGVFVMHNRSPNGENVGCYRQGIKYPGAGPTWAGTDEIIDWQTNPTSGAVGVELSFTANGTDNNGARVAYDVSLRKRDGAGASPVASWGYRIQTEAGAKFVRGFAFVSGATADVGFDTSLATINTAAFKMAEGQAIIFNAVDSRKLFHNGGGWQFTNAANAQIWGLNDDYSLTANGVQLLGTRRTGWGAPTGTATRTTFVTSSVTLEQLAQRVKALIDDLTMHGLIGA